MLKGYRLLDLATEQGSSCGKILADLGVDVIKVENPVEMSRDCDSPSALERSLFRLAFDSGKRSVTLDLTTRRGRELLVRLVESANFMVESFAPGYLDGLGLGYEALRQVNPGIILTSISPFGQTGPFAKFKGPDLIVSAMGGLTFMCGDTDRAPLRPSFDHSYVEAGAAAAAATLVAHHCRRKTGLGQHVDVSIQEAVLACTYLLTYRWESDRAHLGREGTRAPRVNTKHLLVWPCKDGAVCWRIFTGSLGARTGAVVEWMNELGMAGELAETRWQQIDFSQLAQEQVDHWEGIFRDFFIQRPMAEVCEQTTKRGAMLAPMNTLGQATDDPHLTARQFWLTADCPESGEKLVYPRLPFWSSAWQQTEMRKPPTSGEHNNLLAELAPEGSPGAVVEARAKSGGAATREPGRALEGMKILDLTWNVAGPLATKYLADYGATVIKVESASKPDRSRISEAVVARSPNQSIYFSAYNTSKLDMGLNLSMREGRDVLKRLISWADAIVESYTPGTLERWGLSYEAIQKVRADAILVRVSLYGQTGPKSTQSGFGTFLQAGCGLSNLVGWPDRQGGTLHAPISDNMASWFVLISLLAALEHRDRTGEGQSLDIALQEATMYLLAPLIMEFLAHGRERSRMGNRHPCACPHGVFRCKGDDRWCAVAVFNSEEWRQFCEVTGSAAWTMEERFATVKARQENADELERLTETWTIERPAQQVMIEMQDAGVPAGVVQNGEDLLKDVQLKERRSFRIIGHPEMGPLSHTAPPFRLLSTPSSLTRPPLLGEHIEYVCREILGMSDAEFVGLVQAGVLE